MFGKEQSNKGMKFSEEHKAKISQAHKGKIVKDSTKEKLREIYKGKSWEQLYGTEKANQMKERFVKSRIGKPRDIETKEKIRQKAIGHIVSKDTREKVSLAFKGKTYEQIMGKSKAEQLKQIKSDKFKGNGNPFFNRVHSFETKEKMSQLRQGVYCLEKHPNWLGGKSFEPYDKTFNKAFRQSIRKRDNYVCLICNIHQEKLTKALAVHHINYNKFLSIPENCISLCRSCHAKTNFNREHWIAFFHSALHNKFGYVYSNEKEIILQYG